MLDVNKPRRSAPRIRSQNTLALYSGLLIIALSVVGGFVAFSYVLKTALSDPNVFFYMIVIVVLAAGGMLSGLMVSLKNS